MHPILNAQAARAPQQPSGPSLFVARLPRVHNAAMRDFIRDMRVMVKSVMRRRLLISDYRLCARLGVTDAERAVTQPISICLTVQFAAPPGGEETDRIDDTLCYGVLCEVIRETALAHPHSLIESLAADIHIALMGKLEPGDKLTISVTKMHPPIAGLHGGATYEISAL